MMQDLVEFDKYTNFDVYSLDAVKIREAIIQEVNTLTTSKLNDQDIEDG